MRKRKKSKTLLLGLSIALLTAGGTAQAALSYQSYNVDVPRLNGSASTGWQKMYNDMGTEVIDLQVDKVGGDYTVDARANANYGYNTSWIQNVKDNQYWQITTKYLKDDTTKHRIQFSNDLATPVNVKVVGSFKNN